MLATLPGFKKIQPRVYSGFYPVDSNDYQESKKALDKLSLNDNSFTYEPREFSITWTWV